MARAPEQEMELDPSDLVEDRPQEDGRAAPGTAKGASRQVPPPMPGGSVAPAASPTSAPQTAPPPAPSVTKRPPSPKRLSDPPPGAARPLGGSGSAAQAATPASSVARGGSPTAQGSAAAQASVGGRPATAARLATTPDPAQVVAVTTKKGAPSPRASTRPPAPHAAPTPTGGVPTASTVSTAPKRSTGTSAAPPGQFPPPDARTRDVTPAPPDARTRDVTPAPPGSVVRAPRVPPSAPSAASASPSAAPTRTITGPLSGVGTGSGVDLARAATLLATSDPPSAAREGSSPGRIIVDARTPLRDLRTRESDGPSDQDVTRVRTFTGRAPNAAAAGGATGDARTETRTVQTRPIDARSTEARPSASRSEPPPAPTAGVTRELFDTTSALSDARRRAEMAASGDRTGLARARVELAILLEVVKRDPAAALAEYRAAHAIAGSLLFAIAGARRLTPLRPIGPALSLLEAELRLAGDPPFRALRLFELGRLLAAGGSAPERTCQAFRDLLALEPEHPGALRGLEVALFAMPRATDTPAQLEAIAAHLEFMANAWGEEQKLAAWLQIERGGWLEKLGRSDTARAAFDAALAQSPGLGPVRDAVTRHFLVRRRIPALMQAWAEEAALEHDEARAARLLYAAARLASERLSQPITAIDLHERVITLADGSPVTRRAALRELARLYEAAGNTEAMVATEARLLALGRDAEQTFYHRRLARGFLKLGRFAEVVEHARAVLRVDPDDVGMRDQLDDALRALGQHEQRMTLFTAEASRVTVPAQRTELLLRSARIAEVDMRRPDLALISLRAAWSIDPSNTDVCDGIQRLLTPGTPPVVADPEDPSRVRARIDFYTEAAAAAPEQARKIAFLEKLAILWEDEVRNPEQALKAYAEILAVAPTHRGAILALQRCATRAKSPRELFRALVLEADQALDASLERALLLRAAETASERLNDADTALDLVGRVLSRNAGDPAALRAAYRIHERSGRHEEGLSQLRLLLSHTRRGPSRYALQAEVARVLEDRLRRPQEALAAWREAAQMDPSNPTPRFEIRRILENGGDYSSIVDDLAALAPQATTREERGELLLEAAEICDDRLDDPERTIGLLLQARGFVADEEEVTERLERAYVRANRSGDLGNLLDTTSTQATDRRKFALATVLADDRDLAKAGAVLGGLVDHPEYGVAALRMVERTLRRTERWTELGAVLRKQAGTFETREARLGALLEVVALEQYGGVVPPEGQPAGLDLVHELAPENLLYHEAVLRKSGLHDESVPMSSVTRSLGILAACSPDPHHAAGLQLAAALLLEAEANHDVQVLADALRRYQIALDGWPECLTAARGAHRLAARLSDREAATAANLALGNLELDPAVRATRLTEAAKTLASSPSTQARAPELFCRALAEDPTAREPVDAIVGLVDAGFEPGRAVDVLRSALERTNAPEQAARLGAALASVATRHLKDPTVGLEALRRARRKAPGNVPNLLTLAEASAALGLHAEAAEAATSALGTSRDPTERLRAAVLVAEAHAETPASRELARGEAVQAEKLAEEVPVDARASLLMRVASVYQKLDDVERCEQTLIRAIVFGTGPTALGRLADLHAATSPDGAVAYSRTLREVLSFAESRKLPKRPEWLCALGRLEATALGNPQAGLARLREAVTLAPARVETYEAILEVHGLLGSPQEAALEITSRLSELTTGAPKPEQLVGLLALVSRASRLAHKSVQAAVADDLAEFVGGATTGSTAAGTARGSKPGGASESGVRSAISRPLAPSTPTALCLTPGTIVSSVLSTEPYPLLLEVAAALSEVVPKLLRVDAAALGLSTRERLAARAPHALRGLADRFARAFGDLRFDLFVEAASVASPRLLPGDPAAIVLPRGYAELTEAEQTAGLARLLTYVALEVPWIEELPADDIDGLLFGALQVGRESWGQGQMSPRAEASADAWRPRVQRAAGRKLKRTLEELATRVPAQADTQSWQFAVRMAGFRLAFVLTGNLGAALNHVLWREREANQASRDALLAKLFETPALRDTILFALSDSSVPLRRAAGTA